MTSLPLGLGVQIGLNDRLGNPIHIGDTLSFDEREWGAPDCEFTVTLERGQIHYCGGPSDLPQFCEIIRRWDVQSKGETCPDS